MRHAVDGMRQIADRAARLDDGEVRGRRVAALPALDHDEIDRRQDLLVLGVPVGLHRRDVDDRDMVGARDHRGQIQRQHQRGAGGSRDPEGQARASQTGDASERRMRMNDTAESGFVEVATLCGDRHDEPTPAAWRSYAAARRPAPRAAGASDARGRCRPFPAAAARPGPSRARVP